jgi:hypothetical protein
MIHQERLRPPLRDFPADEWNLVESGFHPEFLAQLETIMALGNDISACVGVPRRAAGRRERRLRQRILRNQAHLLRRGGLRVSEIRPDDSERNRRQRADARMSALGRRACRLSVTSGELMIVAQTGVFNQI